METSTPTPTPTRSELILMWGGKYLPQLLQVQCGHTDLFLHHLPEHIFGAIRGREGSTVTVEVSVGWQEAADLEPTNRDFTLVGYDTTGVQLLPYGPLIPMLLAEANTPITT